jgi:hypothetical protein
MSNNDLKTTPKPSSSVGGGENEVELTQWNVNAVGAEAEPQKYRSRLRIIAVLAGLNVSTPENSKPS